MSGRALALWRQLEQATGRALLVTTGGLDHRSGHEIQALFDVLSAHSVVCALLSAREATERWPHLHFEAEVLYQPEAGVIDPELTMAETTRLAERNGAQVLREVAVEAIEPAASGVKIKLKDRTLQARRVVCAVGPWTPTLLGRVAQLPSLTVTQQTVFHFARRQSGFDPWPIVFHEVDRMVYGLPGGRDGGVPGNMKLGEHAPGPTTSADGGNGVVDADARRRMVEYVRRWWPGLEPEPVAEYDCLYTWTPSEDFFIQRHGRLVVCSACSGHAAKFTPLIGEWLADLVEGRKLPFTRFAR